MEETDKPKQRSSVISDLELEVIYDRVLYKIDFFRDLNCHATIWDECIPYLDRLVKHPSPDLYVSKIKNELRERTEIKKPATWGTAIRLTDMISTQLYIILFYLYKDKKIYIETVLPSLTGIMGYFKEARYGRLEYLQKLLKDLPECNAPVYTQGAAMDSKLLQEKDETITNLRKEIAKLTGENVLLREENKKLKEQDDPDDETILIDTGQGDQIRHYKMTARKAVEIVAGSEKSTKMSKEEWKPLLSKLTGLSEASFKRYMSLMP